MELTQFAVLSGVVVVLLLVDLFLFARGREPTFREGVIWSIGWLVLSLLATFVVLAVKDADAAVEYVSVYLIERSLSLDNLFVFLILFGYFGIHAENRARLIFFGIVFALILRGLAIIGGVALLEQFDWVIYILAATLLYLGYRVARGAGGEVDPDKALWLRAMRKVIPVDFDAPPGKFLSRHSGKLAATPMLLCMVGIVLSDIAFAIDSIPAAFGITRDEFVIWMGNAFALLGLRALFVLVDELVKRLRYLDETIGAVLIIVALKLILENALHVHLSPLVSLGVIAVVFAVGITASLVGDRREEDRASSGEVA
jgi:tellurite resistance protein TerC